MRADEIMQRMWDEDVAGIADQNKRLTAEEVLTARTGTIKALCRGAIRWQFHGRTKIRRCVQTERLLETYLSIEKHLQPRLEVAEKYCQVIEAKVWKNESKGYFRITSSWYLPHFHVVREDKETTKVRIVTIQ